MSLAECHCSAAMILHQEKRLHSSSGEIFCVYLTSWYKNHQRLVTAYLQLRLKLMAQQTKAHLSSFQFASDLDITTLRDDLQVCKNNVAYSAHQWLHLLEKLKIWSELDSISSGGQWLVLEGLGASWRKPLIKRAGEPAGCLMKQGHLGFTRGGRVSITTHQCWTIVHCSSMLRNILSLKRNVKYGSYKSSPPPVPSLTLFAITEGDVIAMHDEIVHVMVHFIQAKCT